MFFKDIYHEKIMKDSARKAMFYRKFKIGDKVLHWTGNKLDTGNVTDIDKVDSKLMPDKFFNERPRTDKITFVSVGSKSGGVEHFAHYKENTRFYKDTKGRIFTKP